MTGYDVVFFTIIGVTGLVSMILSLVKKDHDDRDK